MLDLASVAEHAAGAHAQEERRRKLFTDRGPDAGRGFDGGQVLGRDEDEDEIGRDTLRRRTVAAAQISARARSVAAAVERTETSCMAEHICRVGGPGATDCRPSRPSEAAVDGNLCPPCGTTLCSPPDAHERGPKRKASAEAGGRSPSGRESRS
jgi:hypothetical protein